METGIQYFDKCPHDAPNSCCGGGVIIPFMLGGINSECVLVCVRACVRARVLVWSHIYCVYTLCYINCAMYILCYIQHAYIHILC